MTDVATDNGVRVAQTASGKYAIHQFKDYIGGYATVNLTWNGQSDYAPSSSTVALQIYNYNTTSWETVATNSVASVDTDFDLTANIADTTNYVTGGGYITCRVYQNA